MPHYRLEVFDHATERTHVANVAAPDLEAARAKASDKGLDVVRHLDDEGTQQVSSRSASVAMSAAPVREHAFLAVLAGLHGVLGLVVCVVGLLIGARGFAVSDTGQLVQAGWLLGLAVSLVTVGALVRLAIVVARDVQRIAQR